jgi:hypothetical protein
MQGYFELGSVSLGQEVEVCIVAWRPIASVITKGTTFSYHDVDSPDFKRIYEAYIPEKFNYVVSVEFLLWLSKPPREYTIMFARAYAQPFKANMHKTVRLGLEHWTAGAREWYKPVIKEVYKTDNFDGDRETIEAFSTLKSATYSNKELK